MSIVILPILHTFSSYLHTFSSYLLTASSNTRQTSPTPNRLRDTYITPPNLTFTNKTSWPSRSTPTLATKDLEFKSYLCQNTNILLSVNATRTLLVSPHSYSPSDQTQSDLTANNQGSPSPDRDPISTLYKRSLANTRIC